MQESAPSKIFENEVYQDPPRDQYLSALRNRVSSQAERLAASGNTPTHSSMIDI